MANQIVQRFHFLSFYSFFKRLLDVVGSLLGIVLGFPVLFFTYILIILDSKGPAVFKQTRLGKDNKLFEMYKFRTMVINAEEILKNDPNLLREYQSNSYKIKNDPRVTRVGNFLRKSSLDELPQLFNILKGEMSIVGPRAYKPDELATQLKKHPELRSLAEPVIKTKPGLTGLWQTSGRSNIGFEERIKLDNRYAISQNLFFDLWLILKTIPAVLKSRGAY
ncbi:sugar transferase [candidate division WWE3 bacterium]|uniref:Sugar transferase n=1 Tax=candidate division WWE3 bacterium TaxID=2053526 RepID=A0A7X9HSI8_UNCKA|nr:sugar transferase [candidate division WWE3 bacterium]